MWLCVDKDGTERRFSLKPKRDGDEWDCFCSSNTYRIGSIEKIIDRKITWADEPVFFNDDEMEPNEELE